MKKLLKIPLIGQFVSYFFVGGASALVEWALFALFANVLDIHYIAATCLAFVFSTAANWCLGRLWTFKDNKAYENQKAKEVFLVFAASAAGLLLNMGLMYLFVAVLGLDTPALKTAGKVAATGIVFFWNFLIRKFVIYK
mgnify:FL=1